MNKDIRIEGSKVFFGNKECMDYYYRGVGDIPKWWVIRVMQDNRWAFVCGLDLIDDMFWTSGFYLDNQFPNKDISMPETFHKEWRGIERIFNNIHPKTAGCEWAVFAEEPYLEEPDYTKFDDDWD